MNRAKCSKCRADIIWVKTAKGKNIPLDAAPNEAGNMYIYGFGDDATAHALKKGESPPNNMPRYMPHHATCPNAKEFRK